MSLPKKGLRKITVDKERYVWKATGNDGWINLTIASINRKGQILTAQFDYHSMMIEEVKTNDGLQVSHWKQQLVITPYIVRQVIMYGLNNGWNPKVKAPQIDLYGLDDIIDLRLKDVSETKDNIT